jgi:hypothetical protein
MALIAITIAVGAVVYRVASFRETAALPATMGTLTSVDETNGFIASPTVSLHRAAPCVQAGTPSTGRSFTPRDVRDQYMNCSANKVHQIATPIRVETRRESEFAGRSNRRRLARRKQSQGSAVPGGHSPLQGIEKGTTNGT